MKLLYSLTSPYARKVRVVAAEKRIEIELALVDLSAPDCQVHELNPLGKIPVLLLDDGEALYDSRVIAEYLDSRTPVAHLLPQDQNQRILVKRWEALADGACDAGVAAMLESRRPENLQSTPFIAKHRGKLERGLKALSNDLGKDKWCVNDTFSLADIALGCLLGFVELRYSDIHWQDQYPNLSRHYASLMKRASFKDTVPITK